jgi:SAM-dependent methyltransferase
MITACDISPALAAIARERSADTRAIRVLVGDAEALATEEGPFELIFSRHGVMFFPDPVQAFRSVRRAASPDASLVFSCFQAWESNPWASKLACAAAGKTVPSPGREPSGFAFADSDYASQILMSSGWADAASEAISFDYVAGAGEKAVESALSFHSDLGPAARILQALPDEEKGSAVARMRGVIEQHFDGAAVTFPAAAWIWRAKAS